MFKLCCFQILPRIIVRKHKLLISLHFLVQNLFYIFIKSFLHNGLVEFLMYNVYCILTITSPGRRGPPGYGVPGLDGKNGLPGARVSYFKVYTIIYIYFVAVLPHIKSRCR